MKSETTKRIPLPSEEEDQFARTMEAIVSAIKESGMDPYSQLYGYLTTGRGEYITRTGNARELVAALDWDRLWNYVQTMKSNQQ